MGIGKLLDLGEENKDGDGLQACIAGDQDQAASQTNGES